MNYSKISSSIFKIFSIAFLSVQSSLYHLIFDLDFSIYEYLIDELHKLSIIIGK